MAAIRKLLKNLIPWQIRKLRYCVTDPWQRLSGPPPMAEFSDYNDYWQKRALPQAPLRRWRLAAESLPEEATLLDVGSGSGQFLDHVRSVKPGVKSRGIDFSYESVEMTRQAGFDADAVDISKTDIPGKYDYVTCFEVLEHIPEAEVALRHLKNAFKRQLIISIPNVGYLGCRLRLALFGRFPITMCVLHVKEHVRHWTPRDFCEWVARENLRVVRSEGQYGPRNTPWRRRPALFARGMVYFLEHSPQDLPLPTEGKS